MESVSQNSPGRPPADRQPMCDNDILRLLADQRGRAVAEIATHFGVTQTAIRNRLLRLELRERIERQQEEFAGHGAAPKRGRPHYLYFITSRGAAALVESEDDHS